MAMPENNARQADGIEGAEILPNANGSAPGQYLDTVVGEHRKIVILLPGPPKELEPMYEAECRPRLAATLPERHMAKRMLRMALMPESQVDARTAPIYRQYADVETTILAGAAEIQLHFQCVKPSDEEAQARVDELAAVVEQEMGEAVFSSHGESLEEVVLLMLGLRHMTLAAAESCTGGLLAQRLTAVPGCSQYFLGGAVVYADRLKTIFAEVPEQMVRSEGPVSEAVARALAEGIRRRTGASVGVGITGIAGPGSSAAGPDAEKPIGLVYVGISFAATPLFAAMSGAGGECAGETTVTELHITGDRERVRWWASQHALELVRRSLLEST
jgi:nicotinamide-nucleotide amidase